jgi:cytochrome c556
MSVRNPFAISLILTIGVLFTPFQTQAEEDNRELVKMPPMMQEHMLSNMRDHLRVLDEMLGALAKGDVDTAASVAEARLGMSSMGLHGAANMAPMMPKGMQAAGTEMHHAASRFVIVAKDAELSPGKESQHQVYAALQEIISNCNACHQGYRIR